MQFFIIFMILYGVYIFLSNRQEKTVHQRTARIPIHVFVIALVGVSSFALSKWYKETQVEEDTAQIDELYLRFHDALRRDDHEDALGCIDPVFRKDVTNSAEYLEVFYGSLNKLEMALHPSRKIMFSDQTYLYPVGVEVHRYTLGVQCNKKDGRWYLARCNEVVTKVD